MARLRTDERGVALLMVLWVFVVLTVLVGEFSRGMRDDAIATQNLAEEVQARGVALAGMNQALYCAIEARKNQSEAATTDSDDEEAPWVADGTWHDGTYWAGRWSVRMVDEGGKIALNRADEALLRRVFANLGLDTDAQEAVVDAILDWRDSDSLRRLHGAEADYYRSLPVPYAPKDGPFDSVDELLLVAGISHELYYGTSARGLGREEAPSIPLKDIFSVFNRTANINVRTAPIPVLRVLLGGKEDDVEEVVGARTDDPGSALTLMRAKVGDPVLARRLVDRPAGTIAIDARAVMQDGHVQARVGAVVDIGEDADGFRVVRWFDRLPAL